MKQAIAVHQNDLPVSEMAKSLVGSEIIKLAGQIKKKIAAGEKIRNFTIGDFDPEIFPIPDALKSAIVSAYENNETNYPAANGLLSLRETVSDFIGHYGHFDYTADEILISGGARPLIHAVYQTIVDPGDRVVFPVPSWNNNHYTHLSRGEAIFVETQPEDHFMPSAENLHPHLPHARLVALCSPLNPTGTTFTEEGLRAICTAVLEENKRRKGTGSKPLYLLFDQIYWMLMHGETRHFDPVTLVPELRDYTIYIDGISKAFAATGVRVGWAFGPAGIIGKMRAILSHIGAWAPKAEQVASAKFLSNISACDAYLADFKQKIGHLLNGLYKGFVALETAGYRVQAIAPQAAIYLTVRFDLKGCKTHTGKVLENTREITQYLLNEAGLALVPFHAFGASEDSTWFRLSVGTARLETLPDLFADLKTALDRLS